MHLVKRIDLHIFPAGTISAGVVSVKPSESLPITDYRERERDLGSFPQDECFTYFFCCFLLFA
jgi:hypothetical protein